VGVGVGGNVVVVVVCGNVAVVVVGPTSVVVDVGPTSVVVVVGGTVVVGGANVVVVVGGTVVVGGDNVVVVVGGTVVVVVGTMVVVVVGANVVVVVVGTMVVVVVGSPKKCRFRAENTGSSGNAVVRLVKTFETVTTWSTPESWAVTLNGDWMPLGRVGVVMVLFGVWIVIGGWPTVHGPCCMVSATPPGMNCVPPTPIPVPAVGVSGTGTCAYGQGAKIRQIFAIPERPMAWGAGGPAERPVRVAAWFTRFEIRTDWMVGLDVTGSDTLIGPNWPPVKAIVEMWSRCGRPRRTRPSRFPRRPEASPARSSGRPSS
jgi:hypothetical protein